MAMHIDDVHTRTVAALERIAVAVEAMAKKADPDFKTAGERQWARTQRPDVAQNAVKQR